MVVKNKVSNFLYEDLSFKVRRAFYNVYNKLGFGQKEILYQRALAEEFNILGLKYEAEKKIKIQYNGKVIGIYKPDFVIENKIIIEVKATSFTPVVADKQLYYYLKNTDYRLGFLVNFGSNKIDIHRRIWTKNYKSA